VNNGTAQYNVGMRAKKLFKYFILVSLMASLLFPPGGAQAGQAAEVTAYDLIVAMNSLRVSYGLPALIEDPIINLVAQTTAQTMADNQMSWHIGDASGRLAAAGFGGGSKVWATENFAVGNETIDQIMLVWSDESHMIPAVNPAYCNVGAGVARSSNGRTYYILQAAYTADKMCGEYTSVGPTTSKTGGETSSGISQLVIAVKIATPDSEGKVFHVVEAGQSFWSIAIAYKITIKDLQSWNNLLPDSSLRMGQKLFIPGSNTAGYATPTQPGAIQLSTSEADGKTIHVVQSYQTLSTIAQAYGTTVEALLALNGLQPDWALQIDQKLIIHSSNITPSPTLLAIQYLTPASDGRYYHVVRTGETLSGIANLYQLPVNDLMAWNVLNSSSIILPNQRLFLQVTPPASATPNPAPLSPSTTGSPLPPTITPTTLPTSSSSTATPTAAPSPQNTSLIRGMVIFLGSAILGLGAYFYRRRKAG
jgi:LysM repeat protein